MIEQKMAVLDQLRVGRDKAITGHQLAERLGHRGTRDIRITIQGLIEDGYPICSSPSDPKGYYLATSIDEVQESLATLRNYGKQIFIRYRNLKRASQNTLTGQLSLKL